MTGKPPAVKDQLIAAGISILPLVIMVVMSKPALRQKIMMTLAESCRNFCVEQSQMWQDAAFACARWYNKVRL